MTLMRFRSWRTGERCSIRVCRADSDGTPNDLDPHLGVSKQMENAKYDFGCSAAVNRAPSAGGTRRCRYGAALEGELRSGAANTDSDSLVSPPHELIAKRRRGTEKGLLVGTAKAGSKMLHTSTCWSTGHGAGGRTCLQRVGCPRPDPCCRARSRSAPSGSPRGARACGGRRSPGWSGSGRPSHPPWSAPGESPTRPRSSHAGSPHQFACLSAKRQHARQNSMGPSRLGR